MEGNALAAETVPGQETGLKANAIGFVDALVVSEQRAP
jgi:hypothetical protein